jgi:hypothetical protein
MKDTARTKLAWNSRLNSESGMISLRFGHLPNHQMVMAIIDFSIPGRGELRDGWMKGYQQLLCYSCHCVNDRQDIASLPEVRINHVQTAQG